MLITFSQVFEGSHNRGSLRLAASVDEGSPLNRRSSEAAYRHGVEFTIVRSDGTPLAKKELDSIGRDVYDVLRWVDNPARLIDVFEATENKRLGECYVVKKSQVIDNETQGTTEIYFGVAQQPLDMLFFRSKEEVGLMTA